MSKIQKAINRATMLVIMLIIASYIIQAPEADEQTVNEIKPEELKAGDIEKLSGDKLAEVFGSLNDNQKQAITTEQWAEKDLLDKVDDFSKYPNAQKALGAKHSLILDFKTQKEGATKITYKGGVLSNGKAYLNLDNIGQLTVDESGNFIVRDAVLPNGAVIGKETEAKVLSANSEETSLEFETDSKVSFEGVSGKDEFEASGGIVITASSEGKYVIDGGGSIVFKSNGEQRFISRAAGSQPTVVETKPGAVMINLGDDALYLSQTSGMSAENLNMEGEGILMIIATEAARKLMSKMPAEDEELSAEDVAKTMRDAAKSRVMENLKEEQNFEDYMESLRGQFEGRFPTLQDKIQSFGELKAVQLIGSGASKASDVLMPAAKVAAFYGLQQAVALDPTGGKLSETVLNNVFSGPILSQTLLSKRKETIDTVYYTSAAAQLTVEPETLRDSFTKSMLDGTALVATAGMKTKGGDYAELRSAVGINSQEFGLSAGVLIGKSWRLGGRVEYKPWGKGEYDEVRCYFEVCATR